MFEWNERYNTGIRLIDDQHMEMFRIAARANNLLHDQYTLDKYDQVAALITELKDYTIYHFITEENYMQDTKYKNYFSHKVEHDDFAEKLKGFKLSGIDEDQKAYIEDLLAFVSNWIVDHILKNDKLFSPE